MDNEQENPQQERQGNPSPVPQAGQTGTNPGTGNPGSTEEQRKPGQRDEEERKRKEEEERKRKASGDQGKVGQDTDGDGKVVQPGQTPGQSGGRGLPDNQ